MKIRDLPSEALALLRDMEAPPRLVAHLALVHDVAASILQGVAEQWPDVLLDAQAVLTGASLHDVGKVFHRNELTAPGHEHEEAGFKLLLHKGFPERYARFALTHAQWRVQDPAQLEDLLVALADTVWKGARDHDLELALAQELSARCGDEPWAVYAQLDDKISAIAAHSEERLEWQARHPL